jgi:hypothetical protein
MVGGPIKKLIAGGPIKNLIAGGPTDRGEGSDTILGVLLFAPPVFTHAPPEIAIITFSLSRKRALFALQVANDNIFI